MQKRLISTVSIIISFGLLLTGCKDTEGTVPEASTSEVASEAVSEVISEEVSEEVFKEESEDVVSEEVYEEEGKEVEYVNFSNVDELLEHLEKYDRTAIVQYNFSEEGSSQAIIPNGGYYTIKQGTMITIIPNKEVANVQENVGYIIIYEGMRGWNIDIETIGTDLEVSFTVNYTDGTSEDFTIYVTVE
ncbi:MAG: hypothetical protein E7284_08450 [Lachnospiraceae bacterium]|nr:hypothetical protein [Lachnospiraceae bacterium]